MYSTSQSRANKFKSRFRLSCVEFACSHYAVRIFSMYFLPHSNIRVWLIQDSKFLIDVRVNGCLFTTVYYCRLVQIVP